MIFELTLHVIPAERRVGEAREERPAGTCNFAKTKVL